MLKTITITLLVLAGAILIAAATRPDSFRVERSTQIASTPDKIFALINDFHRWEAWSPWEKVDPQLSRTYTGAAEGRGAIYEWKGNKDIGQGRMEIVESVPASKISIKLDFIAPFEGHDAVDFTLTPQGGSTRVTQVMSGPSPYIAKLMGLFFSMDKMVGEKYEEGLANLKGLAER